MRAAPVDPATVTFAFEDLERRTFVALNRAGDGYHVIAPVRGDDPRTIAPELDDGTYGEPLLREGDLGCSCKGGTYRGSCYATEAATARLTVDFEPAPGWNGAGSNVDGVDLELGRG